MRGPAVRHVTHLYTLAYHDGEPFYVQARCYCSWRGDQRYVDTYLPDEDDNGTPEQMVEAVRLATAAAQAEADDHEVNTPQGSWAYGG